MTGADAAFRLLQLNGITDVRIKVISGTLTDYYDPKNKEICLSQDVFHQEVLPQSVLLVTRQVMHVSMRRDMRRLKFAMQ